MIKNVFIPEKIGSYYIFGKKVVGLEITKNAIRATVVQYTGNQRIIEKFVEESISTNSDLTFAQRASEALVYVLQAIKKYDAIHLALSGSNAIFLYVTVPIIGLNKIKQIIPFEIESQLPFTLDQAVIDCVVTKEYKTENKSDVIAVVVKKEIFNENLEILDLAKVKAEKVTVDLIELSGLLKYIPNYWDQQLNALVISDMYSTGVAIIADKQLKFIRVIPKGFYSVVKKVSNKLSMDVGEVFESISRFGMEQNDHETLRKTILQNFEEILNEMQLTFVSYSEKTKDQRNISQIILSGLVSQVQGIPEFLEERTGIKTEKFNINKLVHNGNIVLKTENNISNSYLISLAAALGSELTEDFNLYIEQRVSKQSSLLNKQLISLALLLLLLFLMLIINGFLNSRKLKKEILESEKQTISVLNRKLGLDKKGKKRNTLKETLDVSKTEIAKEESIWFALSSQNRYSFLKYLKELSSRIDREGVGLDLRRFRIYNVDNETKIDLEGQVAGFAELNIFEQQLRSGPFYNIPRMETPNFNITISVKKED